MGVDVLSSIVISRPLETVAGFSAEPSNAPSWYEKIRSIDWKTEPPLQVGSRIEFVARFLGRTLRYTYEISKFSPNATLVMRTAEGPFPMETTYTWEAEGETSTRMSLRNRGAPTGFSVFVAPLLSIAMRRANEKDLQRLKAVLEGR